MRPVFLATTIVLAMLSGCFGEEVVTVQEAEFEVGAPESVSYTHLRAHETDSYLVCRLLLEKK